MYETLEKYLEKNLYERKKHLDLSEHCIEIGGDSRMFRALLAHYVKTRMDSEKRYFAFCCHACNNEKCSNPKHLYWGTAKENIQDAIDNGTFVNGFEALKRKYTEDELQKMWKENGRKGGLAGGGHNKLTQDVIDDRINDINNDVGGRGRIKRLSEKWNVSHSQVRRFLNKYSLEGVGSPST